MTKLAVVLSRAEYGISAPQVRVEVHLSKGLPGLSIVGLPETAVKESKDRVRAAIMNSGYEFPQHRITINLSPADIPKQGGRYDLPIAIGVLAAAGQIKTDRLLDSEFVGELGLGGELRGIRGVLPIASHSAQVGHTLIVPADNSAEAALVGSCECKTAEDLLQVCAWTNGLDDLPAAKRSSRGFRQKFSDLSEVKGQLQAKRALTIAAAGGHNLLFVGPPGTGKTMLASRLAGILPDLTDQQALETAAIASISAQGFDPDKWCMPPFRAPHHTASAVALVGGGSNPMPGEISLAMNGVLFLDELPEFPRHVLEVLREPLESGKIVISRAARQAEFPAKFQLIASMNPCPCGFLGDSGRECRCTPGQVQHYRNKISGPLLDRIDMQVEVPRISHKDLRNKKNDAPSSEQVQQEVNACRQSQYTRNQGKSNADLNSKEIDRFINLSNQQLDFLEKVVDKFKLSARAYHRIIKVSRTIADLENSQYVEQQHLAEAISYRCFDRLD